MYQCKITVLKKTFQEDLVKEYITDPDYGPCPVHEVGQTFVTGGLFGNDMPEGFCSAAWQALVMPVNVLIGGGKVLGFDDVHIACCTDGNRPVIFKLERILKATDAE